MVLPVVFCMTLLAQRSTTTSVGTGPARAAKVRSPEMLADGRVTFRILAPKATAVLVDGNWAGGCDPPMTEDASGPPSFPYRTSGAVAQPQYQLRLQDLPGRARVEGLVPLFGRYGADTFQIVA